MGKGAGALTKKPLAPSPKSFLLQHKDFRQGAALFAAIQAVAHQEALLHDKAHIIQGDVHFPALFLVNEAANLEGARPVAEEVIPSISER